MFYWHTRASAVGVTAVRIYSYQRGSRAAERKRGNRETRGSKKTRERQEKGRCQFFGLSCSLFLVLPAGYSFCRPASQFHHARSALDSAFGRFMSSADAVALYDTPRVSPLQELKPHRCLKRHTAMLHLEESGNKEATQSRRI
jgi:hypothetical protein